MTLHFSQLKHIATTPRNYRHQLTATPKDTLALRLGRAVHTRWLLGVEPWVYDGRRDKRIKEYAAALEEHDGEEPMKPDEYERVVGMCYALDAHPLACDIRDACTEREKHMTWTRDGIECEGTLDMCGPRGLVEHVMPATGLPQYGILAELKSCESRRIQPQSFQRQGEWYHYPEQTAWYAIGNGTNITQMTHWPQIWVISVESSGAFDVVCHLLTNLRLDEANKTIDTWLETYRQCTDDNSWPGHANAPVVWDADVDFGPGDGDD